MRDLLQPPTTPVSARSFFMLTTVLSWLIWAPALLAAYDLAPLPEVARILLGLLGVLIPATHPAQAAG